MNKSMLLASLATLIVSTIGCGKKDDNTNTSGGLTLTKIENEGGGFDGLPKLEWAPGQKTDDKTLTLNVTYTPPSTQPGAYLVNACLNVVDEDQVGERNCKGQTQAIRIKNLKIVCYGVGESGREPLELLPACPGSIAYHYNSFNFPVVFSVE